MRRSTAGAPTADSRSTSGTACFLDGNSVVRVRAQVMLRDDSTGGWVPMGGGGLSNVSVRKRRIQHEDDQPCKHEYLIHGKRISDQSVVLSCTIKKDFEYNKVMPTFHHWKTGNKKFGLTFQTAADARAFDKGVRMAIEDLLDGISETSPLHQYNMDVGDDDVFMQLYLPMDRSDSSRRSSLLEESTRLSQSSSPLPDPPPPPAPPASSSAFPSAPSAGWSSAAQQQQWAHERKRLLEPKEDKDYSYVKFPPRPPPQNLQHEYSYPKLVDVAERQQQKRDSISSLKKQQQQQQSSGGKGSPDSALSPTCSLAKKKVAVGSGSKPSPPSGLDLVPVIAAESVAAAASNGGSHKLICAHCRESFSYEFNPRGSCQYAPDCTRTAVEAATCLQCAKCLLYHCMSDSEGDYVHPCECSNADGHRTRRWIGLALLSVLVPCLCCYLPLMACYRCGAVCNVCGGTHQAA